MAKSSNMNLPKKEERRPRKTKGIMNKLFCQLLKMFLVIYSGWTIHDTRSFI